MTMPFRNADKVPPIYPSNSVVSIFEKVEDAEAAVKDLDKNGFGEDVIYVRDDEAKELERAKKQQLFAHVYRAMQAVMSDELPVIKMYEKKIAEGASFVLVPLSKPDEADHVGKLLKAHNVTLAHFLGRSSFRPL